MTRRQAATVKVIFPPNILRPPRRCPSHRVPVNGVSAESLGHISGISEGECDWSCQYCGAMNWKRNKEKKDAAKGGWTVVCHNRKIKKLGLISIVFGKGRRKETIYLAIPNTFVKLNSDVSGLCAQPAIRQPAVSQPAVRQPAVRQPAVRQPAVRQPAVRQPAVRQPAVRQPAVRQPAVRQPAVRQPAVRQPAVRQPAVRQPAVRQPAVRQPAVRQPAVRQPAMSQPAVRQLAVNQPAV
ncbi:hypothetical protein Tco_0675577 [Tanacetum coccineum]